MACCFNQSELFVSCCSSREFNMFCHSALKRCCVFCFKLRKQLKSSLYMTLTLLFWHVLWVKKEQFGFVFIGLGRSFELDAELCKAARWWAEVATELLYAGCPKRCWKKAALCRSMLCRAVLPPPQQDGFGWSQVYGNSKIWVCTLTGRLRARWVGLSIKSQRVSLINYQHLAESDTLLHTIAKQFIRVEGDLSQWHKDVVLQVWPAALADRSTVPPLITDGL